MTDGLSTPPPTLRWPGVRLASTFLLAEPDERARAQLRNFFTRRGLRPLLTAEGTAVIRLLSEQAEAQSRSEDGLLIDMVIVDADAPGCSGLVILGEVRERCWPVQVVLSSSAQTPGLRERILLLGAAGFLQKPICEVHLRRVYHRLVSGRTDEADGRNDAIRWPGAHRRM